MPNPQTHGATPQTAARDPRKDPRPGDVLQAKDGTTYKVFGHRLGDVWYWTNNEVLPDTVSLKEWREYSIDDEVLYVH